MTFDSSRLEPPLGLSGVAGWFVWNVFEAFIWACVGAAVLVLLLAVHRFPHVAVLVLLLIVFAAGLVWSRFGARRYEASILPRASVMQFDLFRLRIRIVVGTRRDQQR